MIYNQFEFENLLGLRFFPHMLPRYRQLAIRALISARPDFFNNQR